MAKKITWENKEHILPYGTRENQVWDLDMNEIKTVVNANADQLAGLEGGYQGVLLIADTPVNDGYYLAGESGTYTNAGGLVVDLTNTIVFINKVGAVFTTTEITITPYVNDGVFDDTDNVFPATQKSTSDYIGSRVNGIVESGNIDAVSGGAVYDVTSKKANLVPDKNLFDKNSITVDYYVGADGNSIYSTSYEHSDFIAVTEGQQYVCSNYMRFTCYYDSSKNVVAGGSTSSILTFTVPSGVAFVIISKTKAYDLNAYQLEAGSVSTDYEPYTLLLAENELPNIPQSKLPFGIVTEVDDSTDLVPSNLLKNTVDASNDMDVFVEGKNLFNKNTITPNYYVGADGNIIYNVAYQYSDFIPVNENTDYVVSSSIRFSCYYDIDKNIVAGGSTSSTSNFTTPAGVAFVIISMSQTYDLEIYQLEEGNTATDFRPYNPKYILKKEALPILDNRIELFLDFDSKTESSMKFFNNGDVLELRIRPFRSLSLIGSQTFDWAEAIKNDISVHSMGDDAAPYTINGTTLGANHGYVKTKITSASHGKQFVDVGSIWSDGTDEWVIVDIIDANNFSVSARLSNNALTANTLTHVSGATNTAAINSTSKSNLQLFPSINNHSIKVYADNELIEISGTYQLKDSVVFKENYDIMEKNSMIEWLITQVGTATEIIQFEGNGLLRVSISYSYNKYGNCTIYTDCLALEDSPSLSKIMFNMNAPLQTPYNVYVPHTLPFTFETNSYDLTNLTDITTPTFSSRMQITPDRADATGIYADRVLMLRSDVGYALGYLPIQDAEITERRTNASNKALEFSTGKKVYMSAIDGLKTSLTKGDYFSVIAYKSYFNIENGRTAKYIVTTNDAYYLYIDWHVFGIDTIELPNELSGLNNTVIQKSANVTVLSQQNTGTMTFEVKNTDNYGYCIIKFNK